ncbi:MAG: hypothetical protein IT287_09545, partial [Bdellovibrionaceae bacterium]|nr:hypothetical protein [Pseudobdellovibrionaceae bacterium]
MKFVLLALITAVSTMAYAKGGGAKPMTPERFMHESMEYSMVLAGNAGAGSITASSSQFINDETINVTLTDVNGGSFSFQCVLVDELS